MKKPYHTLGKKLIVVSKVAQRKILSIAHRTPIAGHFPRDRTLHAIRARMDWPRVAKHVKELCVSCLICQKAGPEVTTKAPLNPLPVMKEPFARVAMDVFGPLSRTKTGNKYILVLMDYSTKWPEDFPLQNVMTETVVNCLVEVTARIGGPEELPWTMVQIYIKGHATVL